MRLVLSVVAGFGLTWCLFGVWVGCEWLGGISSGRLVWGFGVVLDLPGFCGFCGLV